MLSNVSHNPQAAGGLSGSADRGKLNNQTNVGGDRTR
jgi:hypothetical protein